MNTSQPVINLAMLIDDNLEANYISRKVLEISQFATTILSQTSGESALAYLAKNKGNPASLPEIIFLTVNKPTSEQLEFLSAFEAYSQSLKTNCKIMVLSNSMDESEIEGVLERGSVAGYISKPLLVEKLKLLKSSYLKSPNSKQRIN